MTEYADRHRVHAEKFAEVARATTNWRAQSPVPDWSAQDVVDHLLNWLPALLKSWVDIELPAPHAEGPAERWAERAAAVQALLENEGAGRVLETGPFAGQPLDLTLDRIYSGDIFMHTWDLAAANGLPESLDREFAAHMLIGMTEIEDILRSSGQYGPAKHTGSTDPVARLMAFVGRDVDAWGK